MRLNEYQRLAHSTAVYPTEYTLTGPVAGIVYSILGAAGEIGETANLVKKIIRDDGQALSPERKAAIIKELGDCLWYVAEAAVSLGVDLATIAEGNLAKLAERKDDGALKGSGEKVVERVKRILGVVPSEATPGNFDAGRAQALKDNNFAHSVELTHPLTGKTETVEAGTGASVADGPPSDSIAFMDYVEKIGGDYSFKGHVVSVFPKLNGKPQLVVEDVNGLTLNFGPNNVRKIKQ